MIEGFLSGLTSAGQAAGGVSSLLSLFGLGGKDRPSWKDMQFMMDTSERLAPRDIALQGQYLEGLAPSQAAAYNTYQDSTYGNETQRQIDRIKTSGEQLGMSPWEVMGQGGAAPLPSGNFGGSAQGAQKGDYMSAMIPVKIAEMNNKTALAQTAMQTQSAQQIASQQTAGGELPKNAAAQTAAQTVLTSAQTANTEQGTKTGKAQEELAWTQNAVAENDMLAKAIGTLAQWSGTTTMDLGPYKTTTTNNYPQLAKLYGQLLDTPQNNLLTQKVQAYVATLPSDQFKALERDAIRAAKAAMSAAKGTVDAGVDWLKGFFK